MESVQKENARRRDGLRVALTHDVDRTVKTYQCLTHSVKALRTRNFDKALYHIGSWRRRKDVYWQFNDILKVEESYGVKSTFFFLNESYPFRILKPLTWKLAGLFVYNIQEPRVKEIIRYLDNNGWEVGVHGSYGSFQNRQLLQVEKDTLERIVGHPVIGIRQHFLNWNQSTWDLQREVGFLYDSTWGLNIGIGFKQNRVNPFAPFGDSFTVFPMAIMDSCYVEERNRTSKLRELIEKVIANDAVLVVNWHSNRFNKQEFSQYMDTYIELIEVCKKHKAMFDTLQTFYTEAKKGGLQVDTAIQFTRGDY
jgi:peptidoglycan/xylan/chitin deacetylase (PgdA/CDA1 family)